MDRPPPAIPLLLLLRRFTFRHWKTTPRQSFLLVAILALGIAIYFSIRLANRAAVESFQNFTDMVTQQSDWIITPPSGAFTEDLLTELARELAHEPVTIIPVIETTATRPRDPDNPNPVIGSRETFQLLGIDLVSVQNLKDNSSPRDSWFDQLPAQSSRRNDNPFWNILHDPRSVFISQELATRDNLRPDQSFPLVIQDQVVSLRVAGIIPEIKGNPSPPTSLLIMDLPALQSWAARPGQLDRIEFIVDPGPNESQRRNQLLLQLRQLSQERWIVSTPSSRRNSAATMTAAFRLNLTILSLIALLVGLYLVFQALDGAVVRRREEIGILRSLGVEEGTIRKAWLLEAAVLGLLGGVIGLGFGWLGAQLSVQFVGRTVNALYYATSVQAAHPAWDESLAAVVLAIAASLLAGWIPAREAARTPPAQILIRHAPPAPGAALGRNQRLGLLFLAIGYACTWLPPLRLEGGVRLPWAGYLAALLWIIGGGITGGAILRSLALLCSTLGSRFLTLRLAASHAINPSGRHRWAVAGLICALAMTAGMAILVASFETTMKGWINRTFQADLFISSDGAQSASTDNRILPATWQAVISHPDIADANLVQATELQLPQGQTMIAGSNLEFIRKHTRMAWVEAPASNDIFITKNNSDLALVSESFAERFRKRRDDILQVPTPSGNRQLKIAGVFADYGNERGSIVIDQSHYSRWFNSRLLSNLILVVNPGANPDHVRAQLLQQHPGLSIYTNAHIRQEILRIFRQTFSITYALELIGVCVAVIGLGLTLASVLIERRAELTTLRALGLDRTQIALATAWEGGFVALSGITGGLLISGALGWLLIFVINKQSFGWTLEFHLPWLQLGLLALLTAAAGTTVAYAVGRWGANLPADRES